MAPNNNEYNNIKGTLFLLVASVIQSILLLASVIQSKILACFILRPAISRYEVAEFCKCTKWPQNEFKPG